MRSINRQINTNKIKSVIKIFSTHKNSRPESFTGEFYQTFNGELNIILLKLFQKTEKKEMLSKLFLQGQHQQDMKPRGQDANK